MSKREVLPLRHCVTCYHSPFAALARGESPKGDGCTIGHKPTLMPEHKRDPKWVEYRRRCADYKRERRARRG